MLVRILTLDCTDRKLHFAPKNELVSQFCANFGTFLGTLLTNIISWII